MQHSQKDVKIIFNICAKNNHLVDHVLLVVVSEWFHEEVGGGVREEGLGQAAAIPPSGTKNTD